MAATAALTLAVVHALVWLMDRKRPAHLLFSIIAFSVACITPLELAVMHAEMPAEVGNYVRWMHLPLFCALVSLTVFIQNYLGTGRAWLGWSFIAVRSLMLVINFSVLPNVHWKEIISLKEMVFLGEKISAVDQVVVRSWQGVGVLSILLLLVFVMDASVCHWRKGGREARRKACLIGGGTIGFIIVSAFLSQMVAWGLVKMPVLISPPFLILLGAMTFELCNDIFVSRRAQMESEQLRRELAHAGRVSMMGQLASALAHELNQPLGAILRNAEAAELFLQNKQPNLDEIREIISDIRRDDQRAGEVIDRLRSLLKRRDIESQPLSLNEVLGEVLELTRSDAGARSVRLEVSPEPGLPWVRGDRVHLQQVLINLIINGMDAVNETTLPDRKVLVSARRADPPFVEVQVSDTGPGIPADKLDHVFDPFYTTKAHGMGMGLPISRTIIEAHGGRITAENAEGGGALFSFTLRMDEAKA